MITLAHSVVASDTGMATPNGGSSMHAFEGLHATANSCMCKARTYRVTGHAKPGKAMVCSLFMLNME